jgi:glycosyltransferase involved in cell wall biosynthesis
LKVLIDDEIFYRQRFGGISRVFYEIVRRLKKEISLELDFQNLYSENDLLLTLQAPQIKPFLLNQNFPLKGKIVRGINNLISHKRINNALRKVKPDIFHPTFYSTYYFDALKASQNTKLVFTVHDLIHEKFGENNHYKDLAIKKKENINKADAIIVVSENTKKDLLEIYPNVQPEKIHVNYLAQSITEYESSKINLAYKYILYVGSRSFYKGFDTILQALAQIRIYNPSIQLLCTGSDSFNAEEQQKISKLDLTNAVIHKSLSTSELRSVYENAEMFVFPSNYEGFGIPILEAFACKTPVIISDSSCLPEIAGNAALIFEKNNHVDLVLKMKLLMSNQNLKNEMIQKGITREKEFSWENHYKNTLAIYKSLC